MADRETLLKAQIVELESPGATTQPQEQSLLMGTPDDAIPPPLPLEGLQQLTSTSAVRGECIAAIARNTVGLGYNLVMGDGVEREIDDPAQEAIDCGLYLDAIAGRDRLMNRPSFTDLLYACKYDEEEVGQGYMEVSRDARSGLVTGLFHLPAYRMRRRADRTGWKLLPPNGDLNNVTPFYNYGEKVAYNKDGTPTNQLLRGARWQQNEVIVFNLYTSDSRDYGLPRDQALTVEHLGDKLAVESNVSFFDSSGAPPTVLFVTGTESEQGGRVTFKVPQETAQRIADTLKSDGGHRKRVALIPLPPGAQVNDVKLGTVSDRDMGFTQFREDNARRTIAAFHLQPIFVPAIQDAGRYTAEVQRAIVLEQLFDPEQTRWENTIRTSILTDIGFPHMKLKFKRMAVEADSAKRDSADSLALAGAITRRELRRAHGYEPLPEAAKAAAPVEFDGAEYDSAKPDPGFVPFGWNDKIVQIQKAPAPGEAGGLKPDQPGAGKDNRGLKPGVGSREQRSSDTELAAQKAKTNGGSGG